MVSQQISPLTKLLQIDLREDPRINLVSLTVRRVTVWYVICYKVNMGLLFKKNKKKRTALKYVHVTQLKPLRKLQKRIFPPW